MYSRNEAEVEIKIVAVNDVPLINDFNLTRNEDEVVWFRKFDFVANFKDVDNDELTKIRILTLPNNGTLKL